ncbi:MAG: GNAT family N-acetyltransferase [Verrucomicrobiota bacterium]
MIRIFQHGDHIEIAEIFFRAIHEIGSEAYNKEQCLAWSDRIPDYEHWKSRCELKKPFVSTEKREITGFLELDSNGHIDCAYIKPEFKRRGIMTKLVEHAIQTCFENKLDKVVVEASICAKPLFEKLGFTVMEDCLVDIKGVKLRNYKMEFLKKHPAKFSRANTPCL